ncbi:MAG: cation diffusion facilitator family transporter [Oscillospiraceae bacterium]|nr:cation diffusion facilitator family transporter [Oscillospiraceae bacterium]
MERIENRSNEIVRVSRRGIGVNLLLVAMKAAVGFAAGSIAVILDAVNNLSDALSSAITIVGTHLAGKAADKKHPYGHGRIEYIASLLIALIVLAAGLSSLKESVLRIIHPKETDFRLYSLGIIAAAIVCKLLLGRYFLIKGKALSSGALSASGKDALFDAVISLATLISAGISMIFPVNPEGWLGIVISLFILKAGVGIVTETAGQIIGIRADSALSGRVREIICSFPEVHGAYDLILHSYGHDSFFGSVHIEVDEKMTVAELDALTRRIVPAVYAECGVLLTVGVYAANNDTPDAKAIRSSVETAIAANPRILQMHGFYLSETEHTVSFDLVFDYGQEHPEQIIDALSEALSAQFPAYQFCIHLDRDFSVSD